jgi:hypothetical protein
MRLSPQGRIDHDLGMTLGIRKVFEGLRDAGQADFPRHKRTPVDLAALNKV